MSRYTRPYRHHTTSQPNLAANLNARKRVEGRGQYTPTNRYVVDLILYFVCPNVFDIVDFDATKGQTSMSCVHAIFEHEERANPLHPPQYCTTLRIEYEHSIPRVL